MNIHTGELGRILPPDWTHVSRYLFSVVAPETPVSVERDLDPGYSVWSIADCNQGSEGACVGYGTSRMMTILNGQRYDPRWLWNQAKAVDGIGWTNPGDGNGTTVRAACDILRDLGHVRIGPDGSDLPVALTEGILENRWATTVDEIRNSISLGIPVCIGVNWYTPGMDAVELIDGERWIGRQALTSIRGGHCVCLYGASDQRQAFHLANSWGTQPVWIPYATLQRLLNEDGEATLVTDRVPPADPTGPVPTPLARQRMDLHPGDTLQLQPGVIYRPPAADAYLDTTILGDITVPPIVRGPGEFRCEDGSDEFTVEGGVAFERLDRLNITGSHRITLTDWSHVGSDLEGLHAGACDGVLLERYRILNSGQTAHGDLTKCHGWYGGWGTKNVKATDGFIADCMGCAVKSLSHPDGRKARNWQVTNLEIYNCGSGGTPAFQLDGAEDHTYTNVLCANSIGMLTVFEDDSARIIFDRLTLYRPEKWVTNINNNLIGAEIRNSVLAFTVAMFNDRWSVKVINSLIAGKSRKWYDDMESKGVLVDCMFYGGPIDDLFIDAGNDDFRLKPDVPAGIGWRPVDDPDPEPQPPIQEWQDCPTCIGAGHPAGKVPAP